MKPENWQQLDQLFHSALEHEPSERAAFLDEACGGDDSLRKQVEALLAAHDEAASFIEKPAIEVEARFVASDKNELTAGQTIGHYQIVSKLGVGGMAEVYLAKDTTLGRKVALKLLPFDFTRDIDRVRRFQQEARAASALNHPNIITIHEVGQVDQRHFIATEFIDGETLRQQISRNRSRATGDGGGTSRTSLPLHEVLKIAIQTADALAAAHEAGIVHRDIKPENIMVRRRDAYIKVLDFGLAKLTEGVGVAVDTEGPTKAQVKTSVGLVMGTVNYMSPEQTRGEQVDVRTDIWSIGVVLYELVAGCAPFERPTPSEVIALILEREPPPLTQYVRKIPSELERIISKSLIKDREQRYQTAEDLLVDLRHLQKRLEVGTELDRSEGPVSVPAQLARTNHEVFAKVTRNRRSTALAAVSLILMIAALIYFFYLPTNIKKVDSIAVLPLVNVSGDPDSDFLSEGISEELINSFSRFPQLRVSPRTTTFHYKGKEIDPRQLGRELGVQSILTGKLMRRGDMLVLQVELVETSTGSQVWGQGYDYRMSDLLALKQVLARDITLKLRSKLTGEDEKRLTKGDTSTPEAYQSYLRGMHLRNSRIAANLHKAMDQFQQAISQDPDYALAYVGLADCYISLERYAGTPSIETMPKARAAIGRALQIDDSIAEAHSSLGMIELYSWNFNESERENKLAIELRPDYSRAHLTYYLYLKWMGRFDEAMAEANLAQQLEPLSTIIGINVAQIHMVKGELDAAIEAAMKNLELDAAFVETHRTLGVLYRKQGRYNLAISEFEKALDLSGRQSFVLDDLAVCYAIAGKKAHARAILGELEEKYYKREALGQNLANVYAALDDREQAFGWLEKDFQTHSGFLPEIAVAGNRTDIMQKKLSGDPRWHNLLRRIWLPQN